MHPYLSRFLALAAAMALCVGLIACGGDDNGSGGGASTAQNDYPAINEAPEDSQKGGTLTVMASGDVDSLDPGAAYYQFTYMVLFATQRTLMAWPPDVTDMPVPDLAAAEPEISEDGRTLTFEIKQGVSYSPPVDREIEAADFKYAIERGLMPGVANGYIGTYLTSLEGFEQAVAAVEQDPTAAPEISGITAPDERTLQLSFTEPVALTAMQVLSLPIGAPVPEDYAAEFDAENPSTYAQHAVGTGPYMVENDPQTGELTGYTPGEEIVLVRNPNWDAETDFRPAYLDGIEVREGFDNTGPASQRILDGEAMVSGDFSPDPPVLEQAASEYPDQLTLAPQGGNRYVTLNTQLAPFDDLNVRKAVLAAVDREAMRLTRGGEIVGPIANHFIPPAIPGFEEAGGYEGTGVDFLAEPAGDMELAADYMRRAGFESGQYEGDATVLMVGENTTVERRTAEVVLDALQKLGFDVDYQPVTQEAMYTRFCTVPDAEVAVCPNIGWLKDFNSAQTILEPTFSGDAIQPENNTNISELDVPEINRAMADAAVLTDPDEQAEAWGEIDRDITAQAPAVPWAWDYYPILASSDVVNVTNAFSGNTDLSSSSLTSP